jgi:NADH:ubiquinone oxidoreductase subunit 6 (subunit J)
VPQTPTRRNAPLVITVALLVLGIALIIVSVVYFTRTAADLPSFFPGYQAGSAHHHSKHGVVALILGLLALAGAWISLGTKPAQTS